MNYQGGKSREVKKFGPVIKELADGKRVWHDVTLGGGNVSRWVFENCKFEELHLSDKSQLAIAGTLFIKHHRHEWEHFKQADIPESLYKQWQSQWRESRQVSNDNHWPGFDINDPLHRLIGWTSFALSYNGRCFDGFAKNKRGNDFMRTAIGNARRQHASLQGSHITLSDYRDIAIRSPTDTVLFADPPYKGMRSYSTGEKYFNHSEFWDRIYDLHRAGVQVFVTEAQADQRFADIWSTPIRSSRINSVSGPKRSEWADRLFVPTELLETYKETLAEKQIY